ncbi:hypothetical protein CLV58_103165 [Spirosoma oryzae]|uniref:Uncharacterized protein n=1 Tax=Spirosoma oryzae TaxID=1469603 RepID=A0A2T0TEU9_9BACT|nr:hypothetical protein CLV58_103165 [Spirosoma oryzae]
MVLTIFFIWQTITHKAKQVSYQQLVILINNLKA